MTRWIRVSLALFLSALTLAPPAALAHPVGPDAPYTVRVEDEHGRTLRTFHHEGETFVLGSWGERYVIRIANHTGRRVEAVVSVDGRDVVSGHVGNYETERGYLIPAWDEVVVEGFRKSVDDVAAFRFTHPEASYSSRMGTPENVGVIGVAFFPEAVRRTVHRWPVRPYSSRRARPHDERYDDAPLSEGAPAPTGHYGTMGSGAASSAEDSLMGLDGAPAERKASAKGRARGDAYADAEREQARQQNLGTEYGETVGSHVREVAFRRANAHQPEEIVALRYDDRDGLIARGIRVDRRAPRPYAYREPLAFPDNRFAPPPP